MPNKADADLKKQKAAENKNAIERLPEFKTLNLTKDPEQVKTLIKEIERQADARITEAVHEIDDRRFVLVGRCFSHLKTITDKGAYTAAIQELGRSYDEVKFQVKFTETYIKQALTHKKDIDVLFGPGKMGTMARLFKNDELKQLGDGKKVYGLTDAAIANMSQRDTISHVKAAKLSEAHAIVENNKTKKQLHKSHADVRQRNNDINELKKTIALLKNGPKNDKEVGQLADHAFEGLNLLCTSIVRMNQLSQSEKANEITQITVTHSSARIRELFDDLKNIETPKEILDLTNIEKTITAIRSAVEGNQD